MGMLSDRFKVTDIVQSYLLKQCLLAVFLWARLLNWTSQQVLSQTPQQQDPFV